MEREEDEKGNLKTKRSFLHLVLTAWQLRVEKKVKSVEFAEEEGLDVINNISRRLVVCVCVCRRACATRDKIQVKCPPVYARRPRASSLACLRCVVVVVVVFTQLHNHGYPFLKK